MPDDLTPSQPETLAQETPPYKKRHVWVSVVLSFFGSGLPLIYCGNLKGGILLLLATFVFEYIFLISNAFIMTFTWLVISVIISLAVFAGILIFNIRYTNKANYDKSPRIRKTWLWIIFVFLGLNILSSFSSDFIKATIIESYRIPSGAMERTLLKGDYLLANKFIYGSKLTILLTDIKLPACDEPKPGDIIIFKYPMDQKQNYIKRVVAIGGDKIKIFNKQLFVNDQYIPPPPGSQFMDSTHVYPHFNEGKWGMGIRDNMPVKEVPIGYLFIMGDNRDNSADSRFWGFLDRKLVIGKPMYIFFSWDSEKHRIRWERIGLRLDNQN